MKKEFSTLLLGGLLIAPLAAKPLAEEAGWKFVLSVNAGYVSGKSNMSTENEIIDDLQSEADSSKRFIAFPFVRAQYTTEDLNTQFFLGNSRDQISTAQFQYEFGVTQQFADKSKLTLALFPELPLFNETWEDPYLVGKKRVETDENAQGGRIEFSRVAGSPITLKYAYAMSDIDQERSGESVLLDGEELSEQARQSLQRNSQYHRFTVETMFPVYPKIFLKPSLQYTARLADGDAHRYDDYNFKLGLLIFKGRHTSITTVEIGQTRYDQNNPVFNMKQDSVNAGIFSVYSYAQAFNYMPLTFSLIAGYSQKDSDITFYDESGLMVSTGLAYTF